MKLQRFAARFQFAVLVLIFVGVGPWSALAQESHSHATAHHQLTDQGSSSVLIKTVRDATERFQDPAAAEAEGYFLQFGCVSGPDSGAMGLHFVNGTLVGSGVIDVNHPQIVIYEPTANGRLQLIGADYLVLADTWNAKHSSPPELMGQLFHYFETPNRFGLPAFYTLHVWAWKDNPNGAFVNWHPNVSCQQFNGPTQP